MKKIKWVPSVLVMLLLITAAGCGGSGESMSSPSENGEKAENTEQEKITLRFVTGLSAEHAYWTGMVEPWMERVEELTEGQVQFETFTGGELVETPHEPEALKNGTGDVALISPFYSDNLFPLSAITYLPVVHIDEEIASNAARKLMESDVVLGDGKTYYESQYADNGFFALLVNAIGPYTISTTGHEFNSVDDVVGTSLRTPTLLLEMYAKNIGVNSVSMTASEMYDALSKGAFEGSFHTPADWSGFGFQDLFKYTIVDGLSLGAANAVIAMTQDRWDGLPQDVQDAILQAHDDVFQQGIDEWVKRRDENVAYNEGIGGQFVPFDELDSSVQDHLINGMEDTWHDYIDYLESNGLPGKDIAILWRDLVIEAGGSVPEGVMDIE